MEQKRRRVKKGIKVMQGRSGEVEELEGKTTE